MYCGHGGVVEEEEDDEDDDIGRQVCAGQCMAGNGRHASVLLGKVPPTYLYDRLYYNRCPHLKSLVQRADERVFTGYRSAGGRSTTHETRRDETRGTARTGTNAGPTRA